MRLPAQLNSEPSIKEVNQEEPPREFSASSRDSSGYTFHPKWGYKEKPTAKPRPSQIDAQSPRVSVTVNKIIMDELGKEIGTQRVGNFLQVLLKDWILSKTKAESGR